MTVGILGLGLIGGSMARTYRKAGHRVLASDKDKQMLSFAKLIEFYKKGTPNDGPKVMEFMKEASVAEILGNAELWGQDLRFLTQAVESAGKGRAE